MWYRFIIKTTSYKELLEIDENTLIKRSKVSAQKKKKNDLNLCKMSSLILFHVRLSLRSFLIAPVTISYIKRNY